jgi:hypothetical protein
VNCIGRKIVFFGGHYESDGASSITSGNYNDVHILDLDRNEWTKPNVTGNVPTARSWHSAIVSSIKLSLP